MGPGVPGDAEAIGDLGSDRNRKTQEALEHMQRIWSEEPPYRIEGEFYRTTTERSLDPEHRCRHRGPAAAEAASAHRHHLDPPGLAGPYTAGARGWTGISATYVGAYVVQAQIRSYLEGRRSAGLSDDPSGWRVARSVFVADDEATARRYAHREDGAHGFYFNVMRTKLAKAGALDVMRDFLGQPDSELSTQRCLERLVIAGTPHRSRTKSSHSETRSAPSGRCSTRATIGQIRPSRGAPWSSWRTRSGPGSIEPRKGGHREPAGRYILNARWPNHCVHPTPARGRG